MTRTDSGSFAPTSREILVEHLGAEHALHTAVERAQPSAGTVRVYCSCGSSFAVPTEVAKASMLRLVPERAS